MRTRSFFLISSGLLMATTSLAGGAYAQKGVSLEPKTQWSVSSYQPETAKGYCAIARRFDKNVIMTVARNKKNENSIALDFDSGGFDKDHVYKVFLDPGAGQQRQFDIKPVSKKAFVFRIGSDRPFLNALDRTGYMRVEIDNEVFNINLADIDKGQAELENCVASGVSKASASGGSGLDAQSDVAAKMDVATREKLKQLEAENAKLQARVIELASVPAPLSSPVSAPQVYKTDTVVISKFEEKIKQLEAENAKLQAQYVASSAMPAQDNVGAVSSLAKENMRLQKLVDEMSGGTGNNTQLSVLNNRISALEAENTILAQKLSDAKIDAAKVATLEDQLAQLRQENGQLAKAGGERDRSADIASLEIENKKLTGRIAALAEEKTKIEKQLGESQSKNSALKIQLSENAKDIESASDELVTQLREQLQQMETRNTQQLSMKESELQTLKNRMEANKEAMTKGLDEAVAKRQNLEAQLNGMKESLNGDNTASAKELREAQQQIEVLQSKLIEMQGALEQEKQAAQKALEDAKSDKHASAEIMDAMKQDIASLQTQIDDKKGAIEGYKKDSAEALSQANEQIALLQKNLSDAVLRAEGFERDLAGVNLQLSGLQDDYGLVLSSEQDAQQKLAEIENEKAALLNSIETAAGEDEQAVNQANARIETLEKQLAEQAEVAQNLEQHRIDMESRVQSLMVEKGDFGLTVDALKEQKGELEELYKEAQQKLSDLKKESSERIAMLESDKENLAKQYAELEERFSLKEIEYYAELADLQDEIDVLQEENRGLVLAIKEADRFNKDLQARNEDAFGRLAQQAEQATVLDISEKSVDTQSEEKIALLMVDNEKLKHALETRDEQMRQLTSAQEHEETMKNVAQIEMDKIKARNDQLQKNLADMTEQIEKQNAVLPIDQMATASSAPVVQHGSDFVRIPEHREAIERVSDIEPAAGEPQVSEMLVDEQGYATEAQQQEAAMKRKLSQPMNVEASIPTKVEPSEVQGVLDSVMPAVEARSVQATPRVTNMSVPTLDTVKQDLRQEASVSQGSEFVLPGLSVPVQRVETASKEGFDAYQWRDHGIYGSAMQMPIRVSSDFESFVRDYLEGTEKRCAGDFAISPSLLDQTDGVSVDGYDIACVGQGIDSAASLLFYANDGVFTVVAHEAPVAEMGAAIELRDHVAEAIQKAQSS